MVGLYGLFRPISVARRSYKPNTGKPTNEGFCFICGYVTGNNLSLNNHIHAHLRASLVCCLDGCFEFFIKSEDATQHGRSVHSHLYPDKLVK